MKEEEDEVKDAKCPRKLNFNAPLLSTRRPGGIASVEMSRTNSQRASRDTSNRVPFSWELAPGKPKDMQRNDDVYAGKLLSPKLPPSRWHPLKETTVGDEDCYQLHDHDEGCDGDVDDDNDDKNDVFSDAMDMFSLSESTDIVEKVHGLNRLISESTGNQSPNFIIQRFLPAANALAASSVLSVSKNLNKKLLHPSNYPEECISRTGRSCSSPRGCGLETLFPWRMKHKLCGIKSPVREGSMNLKAQSRAGRKQDSTSAEFKEEGN